MNSPKSTSRRGAHQSQSRRLHFEALEQRTLFDATAGTAPTADVSVSTGELTTNEDQLVNDNIEFNIQFDNNGGQEGYTPHLDIIADPEMELLNITAFGTPLSNPDGNAINPVGVIAADGQLVDINTGLPIDHPQFSSTVGSPSNDYFGGAGSNTPPVLYDPALQGLYVYSVTLPFGSFTPGNPPIDIQVEASLDTANNIDPNTDYTLYAQGGYVHGCDPLANPGTVSSPDDEPIFGTLSSTTVHPVVMSLTKTAGAAEEERRYTGENVSGPNHPIPYRLEVDIATGETVDNIRLTDLFPDDLAYLGNLTITDGSGAAIPFTLNGEPEINTDGVSGVPSSNNLLDITFPSVTGVNGTDIIITYDAFAAYVEEGGELVVNPVSGEENDLDEYNDSEITGDWEGQTVGDNAGPGGDPDGVLGGVETDYIIEEHSLAIQKSVGFADGGDRAAPDWNEGDVAEFTLNFQISDYFAFDNLVVDDIMGDGLEFLPGTPGLANASDFDTDFLELQPELIFTMHGGGTVTLTFDAANFTAVENANGSTSIHFDVYQQLVDSNYISAGDALTGGMIPGVGIDPATMGAFNSGIATQGSIRYRAKVRDEYASEFNTEAQINQGDVLRNNTTITGRNLDVETLTPGVDVTDGSSASIEIATGETSKELFSIIHNGTQLFPGDLDQQREVVPGDLITWRITYTLPSTEFENLSLTDFLPLPIFDENEIDTSQVYAYGDPGYLTAGRISFGPNDTFIGSAGTVTTGDGGIDDRPGYSTPSNPTITLNPDNNSFTVHFGDYSIPGALDPVGTTIELFVTTTIQDGVYADGLLFTNQVQINEADSLGSVVSSNEISLIELTVPQLHITKGIIATESPNNGRFTGSRGPDGVTFNAPGSATAFNGSITSDGIATDPIDANNRGLDAGDIVTFGITVENQGQSDYGAFDVQISDTLPNGFEMPASMADLNLRVTDGNGNLLAFNIIGGGTTPADFFANGIELVDPSATEGSLTEYDPSSGTNLVFIAYDLTLSENVESSRRLTNVATVENFSYEEDGTNYANATHTDPATVTVPRPVVDKQIIDTSHDDVNNTDANAEVAIGEIVTYSVSITIPEGSMPNTRILDTLPPGMAFLGLDSISFDGALQTNLGIGDFSDVTAFYNAGASTLELGIAGVGPGLGTLTNTDRDNTVAETITFTYRAVVLNDTANQGGLNRSNAAQIRWTVDGANRSVTDREDVLVVEPDINVVKSVVGGTTTVEGAQEITYRIVVTNRNSGPNVSEAYEIELQDLLPENVSYVNATLVHTSGIAPNVGTLIFDGGTGPEGTVRATWDRLGVGESSTIEITVRIDDALATDTVITNTAEVEYSSLSDSPGDAEYNGFNSTSADPSLTFGTGPLNTNLDTNDAVYANAVERTGDPNDAGGAANDYNDDGDVDVTVINPVGISKAVIDTAETHTSFDASADGIVRGAIGEVIRYEVRILIPQASSTGVQLLDTLDPGLFWIDAAVNNLQIRLEGFAADGSTLSADAAISGANGSTIAFDDTRVSFNAADNSVLFNFGDIVNTETDSEPEYLYISYNVIVGNEAGVNRGDILTNTVQLREGGVDVGGTLTQTLQVAEPEVDIQKSDNGVTTADAGDLITYTLDISATADDGSGTFTTAFDLLIGDTIPPELELVANSLTIIGLPGTSSIVSQSEDTMTGSISVLIDQLGPGESFQVQFQTRVRDTGANVIHSDESVENQATLSYSSLAGDGTDNGVGENTTGNEAGAPGSSSGERQYSDSDTDDFTSPSPILSKVLANPADTTFTIGEAVEYVLTLQIPEGRVGQPDAYILDSIGAGFRYIPGTFQATLSAGVTIGTAGSLNETNAGFFSLTDPGDTAQSETLQLDFGFIDFNNAAAENGLNSGTIEIRYFVQVENIVANQEGGTLNNVADFFYTDSDGATLNQLEDSTGDLDTVVTIVEPQVDVDKSITAIPTEPQAGDTVSYQVSLTHPGGPLNPLFDTPAFDITVRDEMPEGVGIQTGTFTAMLNGMTDVSGFFTVGADGFVNNPAFSIDLQPGDEIIITYDALITASVRDGEKLINDVDVEWTSLDDNADDGIDTDDTGERTGDRDFDNPVDPANPNDFENGDEADFSVEFTAVYDFTKTIFSTSATHTDGTIGTDANIEDLTIGETVTYALTVTLGRGTTDGVRILDQLDITNGLLDISNVQIQTGNALRLASGQPFSTITAGISDSAGGDGYMDRVEINFGTIINDPTLSNGIGDEQITIYVTAVVVNVLENQQGDIISNQGDLFFLSDDNKDGVQTEQNLNDDVDIEIVEPNVDVAKTVTTVPANPDAGDTVSYQIVITNTTEVDAFDLTFLDDLPAKLTYQANFTAIRTSDGANVSNLFQPALDGGSISHVGPGFYLSGNDTITITYDAVISDSILDGEKLTNEVDVEWTSLNGDSPDERGGDEDPNNPAGQTNPNDYEAESNATVEANLTGYQFDKAIFSTSSAHTGMTGGTNPGTEDLVIGETVTYAITATFAEGTTTGVIINDIIQLTNGVLDIRNVTFITGSNLRGPGGPLTATSIVTDDPNMDSYNERTIINFGTIINSGANGTDPAADQIIIYVEALVVNVFENQEGDVIQNDASLSYIEDSNNDNVIDGNDTPTVLTDSEVVEIVEPNLSINKSVSNSQPKLDEIITYTLVITNNAGVSTTDAFDIFIDDLMDPRMTLDRDSIQLTVLGTPANPSSIVSNNSSDSNLLLGIDFLEEGQSIQITYEVRVSSDPADFDAVLPNVADLTYTSNPGDNPEERGGDPDPNDPDDPNDYNDEDNVSVEVFQPDLRILKEDGGVSITPGSTLTYSLTVTNQGRAEALDVFVTDDISHYLAAGFRFVSGTNATLVDGIVTFTLPDMPVDDIQILELVLRAPRVIPAGLEEITNIAVTSHLDIDPTQEDNTEPEPTPVIATPDLIIEKDDGLEFARTGDIVTYTITFDNVGDQVASGVIITDTLPPGVRFVSATDGGKKIGNRVVWTLDEVRPGGGDTFKVTVEMLTDTRKKNFVSIADDGRSGPDPTPKNNRDTDITTVKLRGDFVRPHYGYGDHNNDRLPFAYATFMNSGLVQPGSTVTLEVYDAAGRLIGDTSTLADAGGNWLATFPMNQFDTEPVRVVMKQTWAAQNPTGDRGYNFRTYFAPAFATGTYYTENLSIYNVTEKRAATEVLDLYEASKMILSMDWNGNLYEFAARGALQSSSGN